MAAFSSCVGSMVGFFVFSLGLATTPTDATQSSMMLELLLNATQMAGGVTVAFLLLMNCIVLSTLLRFVNYFYLDGRNHVERFGIGIVGGCLVAMLFLAAVIFVTIFLMPSHGMCLAMYHAQNILRWSFPPFSNFLYWFHGGFEVQAVMSGKIYRQYIKEDVHDIHALMIRFSKYPELYT